MPEADITIYLYDVVVVPVPEGRLGEVIGISEIHGTATVALDLDTVRDFPLADLTVVPGAPRPF